MIKKDKFIALPEATLRQVSGGQSKDNKTNDEENKRKKGRDLIIDAVVHWDEY